MSIPKIIHYVHLGPEPLLAHLQKNLREWQALHPSWQFHCWTNTKHPRTKLERCWKTLNDDVKRDYLRYAALHKFGGFFVDLHILPLKALDPLRIHPFVVGAIDFNDQAALDKKSIRSENFPRCSQDLIGSEPNSWMIRQCIEELPRRRWFTRKQYRNQCTGSGMLTRVLSCCYVHKDVKVLASTYFNPFPPNKKSWALALLSKISPREIFPEAYALHLGEIPWKSRHWTNPYQSKTPPKLSAYLANRIRIGITMPWLSEGGVIRTVFTSLKTLHAFGFDYSHIACFTMDRYSEHYGYRLAKVLKITTPEQTIPIPDYIHRQPTWRHVLQKMIDECDVIKLWGFYQPERYQGVTFRGKPVIAASHGSCEWSRSVVSTALPYATHYLAVSQSAARVFPEALQSKVKVIYNMVDANRMGLTKDRDVFRASLGFLPHHKVIGYIGRLAPDKNPLALANALLNLPEHYRALCIGSDYREGVYKVQLKEMCGEKILIIPHIELLGDYYNVMDCLIMATPSEGHCQVVNEAWYMGVPVVSTRVGAVPELEARFGPLVQPIPINPSGLQLAEAVREVTEVVPMDRVDRARKMVAAEMNPVKIMKEWEAWLQSICAEQRSKK